MDALDMARDPNTQPDVLAGLAEHEDWRVREAVAANPAVPEEILARLADDEDMDVRRAVAENPATPVETLVRLAKNRDCDVLDAALISMADRDPSVVAGLMIDQDLRWLDGENEWRRWRGGEGDCTIPVVADALMKMFDPPQVAKGMRDGLGLTAGDVALALVHGDGPAQTWWEAADALRDGLLLGPEKIAEALCRAQATVGGTDCLDTLAGVMLDELAMSVQEVWHFLEDECSLDMDEVERALADAGVAPDAIEAARAARGA